MRICCAGVLLILTAACRQPIVVDTSGSKFIPRDVALERLREVLATADTISCTIPKHSLGRTEIKEWKIDDLGLEARADGQVPIRVAFKDVTGTRLEQFNQVYLVRIFTPAQPNARKDYMHFIWNSEKPARRALELLDALWQKR